MNAFGHVVHLRAVALALGRSSARAAALSRSAALPRRRRVQPRDPRPLLAGPSRRSGAHAEWTAIEPIRSAARRAILSASESSSARWVYQLAAHAGCQPMADLAARRQGIPLIGRPRALSLALSDRDARRATTINAVINACGPVVTLDSQTRLGAVALQHLDTEKE